MGFTASRIAAKIHTTAHAYVQTQSHTNKPAMGTLEIHIFVFHWGNMLQHKPTLAMWVFIINAFVLHTDNILAGERRGRVRGREEEKDK